MSKQKIEKEKTILEAEMRENDKQYLLDGPLTKSEIQGMVTDATSRVKEGGIKKSNSNHAIKQKNKG